MTAFTDEELELLFGLNVDTEPAPPPKASAFDFDPWGQAILTAWFLFNLGLYWLLVYIGVA